MTRLFPIIVFVLLASEAKAQWFNRMYVNGSYGYFFHSEAGGYLHLFNCLSLGYNSGLTRKPTGPAVYTHGVLFTHSNRLRDEYRSKNFLIGVATNRLSRFDASFMVGPSWVHMQRHYNFKVIEDYGYPTSKYVIADEDGKYVVGFVARAEVLFEIHPLLGINASFQTNINSLYTDFSLMAGINFGIVQDPHSYIRSKDRD